MRDIDRNVAVWKASRFFRYKSVQAGRAVAAFLVVLFHLGATISLDKYFGIAGFGQMFSFGHAGVNFFFVLSGFIIMQVHMDDLFMPQHAAIFLKKRLLRIYPIYWLIFLAVYFSALAVPSLRGSVAGDAALIAKALALFPLDPLIVGGTGAPVLIVAWSLQYEMYFYLLFLLAILNRWLALAALALLVSGLLLGWGNGSFPASFIWSNWILLFFMGVAVAFVARHTKSSKRGPAVVIGGSLAFLIGTGVLEGLVGASEISTFKIFWGLGFSGLIYGLLCYEKAGLGLPVFMRHRFTQTLGDASYFLYLIHFPLISLMCKVAVSAGLRGVTGALVAFVLIASACVAASIAGHVWIERPLQKWLSKKILPRRPLVPVLVDPAAVGFPPPRE